MRHSFPYPDFATLEIPDDHLAGVYALPATQYDTSTQRRLIRAALDAPIGSARLAERVTPGMNVLIAVNDSSRSTCTELMLPMVLEDLAAAGLDRRAVTIFIALGTHRPMSDAEMRSKYTDPVVDQYRLVNPDWRDRSVYRQIGQLPGGGAIRIHREVLQADFVIGIGQTIPHMIAGFGGGGKIINPGCSDGDTIGEMHWLCQAVPEGKLFGVRDTVVRELIDDVALKAGLKFILNEVPGTVGIAEAFAGHPLQAHRKACASARKHCLVEIDQAADIVIADAYPADLDFWQALKGMNAAYGAVKDGGTVILVTPCPEGTSSQHDEVTRIGYKGSTRDIVDKVASGAVSKTVGANLLLGRQLLNRAGLTLVTTGIPEADTRAMGFEWAPAPSAALDSALARHGPSATINVLYKASKMICAVHGM